MRISQGTKKLLLQAAGIGAVAAVASRMFGRRSKSVTFDCSGAKSSGGTLEGIRYLESTTDGGSPDRALPMIVVFHSRGASAAGAARFTGLKPAARVIRPEGVVRLPSGNPSWFERRSSTDDQAGYVAEMQQRSEQLGRFLAALVRCRPTIGLPVVTGTSEGGHVAYLLASTQRGVVSGAVALLGWLPPAFWNPRMAPTVGMHGTQDTTVPYQRTEQFWEALQAEGAVLNTQSYNSGHTITSEMNKDWRSYVKSFLQ